MPLENHRHSLRPPKPTYPSRRHAKSHSLIQDGTRTIQPNALLFIDVSDPSNESKRQDRRKAVRSFVMKQYVQSKKTSESQIRELEPTDESNIDATKEALEITSASLAEDGPHSSHSSSQSCDSSQNTERVSLESRQLGVLWPDLENAAQSSSPFSFLGNGSLDPFDSYPARIEIGAQRLLDLYLNTEGLFPDSQAFNRDSRRKTWFPLSCSSKALFHGLIASAASACTVQQIGAFEPLILRHQNHALKALNETLSKDLSREESTATIFAIKTMLLVAVSALDVAKREAALELTANTEMHEGNTRAMKMHFQGAVAVVHKIGSPYKMGRLAQQIVASFACWTSFAPPMTLMIPFAELVWSSASYIPGPKSETSDAKSIRENQSSNLPGAVAPSLVGSRSASDIDDSLATLHTGPEAPKMPTRPQPKPPHYSRNLSPLLLRAFQRVTDLSLLARRARNSTLSLQEQTNLLAGISCGGQGLASLNTKNLSPLEDCIRMTTLIHFFADVVPFEEGDEPRITHLTVAVEQSLSSIDLELLLNDWAEVGLWIAIVVGVFAKAGTWSFFQDLLRLFCGRLKTLRWDAVRSVLHEFQPISSEPFLRCCEAFWLSSMALKSVQVLLGQMSRHSGVSSDITR